MYQCVNEYTLFFSVSESQITLDYKTQVEPLNHNLKLHSEIPARRRLFTMKCSVH